MNSKEQLLRENFIKKCPIDHKAIEKLLKRANVDLKTANRNLELDEDCAYNYAYNALLRSGLALMFSHGFRPEIKNKHLTVVRFSEAVLGKEFKPLINEYNFMRKSDTGLFMNRIFHVQEKKPRTQLRSQQSL